MAAKRRQKRETRTPADGAARRLPLAVVILAAGEGKRMKSALPKVLQPLAGRPLLKHVIDTARSLAPRALHVVYGHGGERVRTALADEAVTWTLQPERLGTGHAVQLAMPQIPDDHRVLVLCGDVPLLSAATLERLLALAGDRGVSILTARFADPTGYGRIVRDRRGLVKRIVEEKDATPAQRRIAECNTGVLAAPARRLRGWLASLGTGNSQGEYYLTDVVALAVRDRVAVHAIEARPAHEALGVNDKVQLAALERIARERAAQALLEGGVTLADPARVDVRGTVVHGSDVSIDVNVVLEGAHIGARCNIGPFARMRPAVELSDEVHIGNFVEVKNSRLGVASKANHLAYVGDARVGTRVNLGAGTIVANYDGAVKNASAIGDDVHTGSNTVLVAPITVGAGATIAAGSTVTHSVPPGGLTIARARQTTLPKWRRPRKGG